jgi:hypothetical protein
LSGSGGRIAPANAAAADIGTVIFNVNGADEREETSIGPFQNFSIVPRSDASDVTSMTVRAVKKQRVKRTEIVD